VEKVEKEIEMLKMIGSTMVINNLPEPYRTRALARLAMKLGLITEKEAKQIIRKYGKPVKMKFHPAPVAIPMVSTYDMLKALVNKLREKKVVTEEDVKEILSQ